jgi:methionine biosynthesis protein MetW
MATARTTSVSRRHRLLPRPFRRYTDPLPMRDFDDYDEYWEHRGGEPIVHPRWEIAIGKIPEGATVLDVGCGAGGFLSYLRVVRPDIQARGVDISEAAVRRARAAGNDVVCADLTREPVPGTYDYITCFEVIEHIADAETVLGHLRCACRNRLVMSLPNIGFIDHRIRLALFGRFPNTNLKFHVKEHVRHWTVRDFTDWTEHYGLDVVSVQGQYGSRKVPWKRYPGLFARQLVYVLEPVTCSGETTPPGPS